MIYLILIQLLLLNAEIVHGTASNSLSDCNTLAAKFSSTCTGGAAVASIIATTGVSVTCTSGFTALTCPGTYSNGICVFYHKLCVTCSGSSPVRIQVQSNGLPRFCPNAPAPISETPIDFTVNFNPDVSVNSPVANPQTAAALYAIACSTTSQSSVPPTSNFIQNVNSASLNVLAGVSIDGVSILNVNSANNVDPFYPTGGFSAESVDACLGHPNPSNIYHYHMASACALTQPSGSISSCSSLTSCSSSIASYAISAFSSYRTLTVIGIAKDGHIIYGPYYSSGVEVTTGFDICNGVFHDTIGNYGYFATRTFPYITGCFGPGNYPSFLPNCTTNPTSAYAKLSSTTSSGLPTIKTESMNRMVVYSFAMIILKMANEIIG